MLLHMNQKVKSVGSDNVIDDHHVFFADSRCDFVKVVSADVCDMGMQLLYFVFLLLPVVAEFNLAA